MIPDQKYALGDGQEVYVWATSQSFTSLQPVSTSTFGNAGLTPFQAYTTSYVPQTKQLSCRLKILTKNKIAQ